MTMSVKNSEMTAEGKGTHYKLSNTISNIVKWKGTAVGIIRLHQICRVEFAGWNPLPQNTYGLKQADSWVEVNIQLEEQISPWSGHSGFAEIKELLHDWNKDRLYCGITKIVELFSCYRTK